MAIKNARAEDGRITPHLMVRGGRNAIEFYTRAFGAAVLYESPMPHGPGLHAHLQIGKTMILITDEQPARDGMMRVAAPESLGGTTTILEMDVDDVDRVYKQAVDAGGKPMMPCRRRILRRPNRVGRRSVRPHLGDLDGERGADARPGARPSVGRVQEAVGAELARPSP